MNATSFPASKNSTVSCLTLGSRRSLSGIKDDLENAGAVWVDEPVVVDGNLVSSRTPRDLAPFGEAMVQFLNPEAKGKPATAPALLAPSLDGKERELKRVMLRDFLK